MTSVTISKLSRDADVMAYLDVAPRTLRRLIAVSDAVGIDAPCVGGGKLRRWFGGEVEWLRWFGEVTRCLHGSRNEKSMARYAFGGSFEGNAVESSASPQPRLAALPLRSRRRMRAASSGDPETTI